MLSKSERAHNHMRTTTVQWTRYADRSIWIFPIEIWIEPDQKAIDLNVILHYLEMGPCEHFLHTQTKTNPDSRLSVLDKIEFPILMEL